MAIIQKKSVIFIVLLLIILISSVIYSTYQPKAELLIIQHGDKIRYSLPFTKEGYYEDQDKHFIFLEFARKESIITLSKSESLNLYLYGEFDKLSNKIKPAQMRAYMLYFRLHGAIINELEILAHEVQIKDNMVYLTAELKSESIWSTDTGYMLVQVNFRQIPLEALSSVKSLCEYNIPEKKLFIQDQDYELIEIPDWLSNVADMCAENQKILNDYDD